VNAGPRRTRPALPVREGVSASCVVTPAGPWPTLLAFLAGRLPVVTPAAWAQRMARGEVLDDGGRPIAPEAAFRPGLRLHYYRELPHEPPVPFEESILYQDDWLVVADKPHFLPVTPTGRYVQQSLLVRLKRRLGIDTLSPIHRIDRETAGVVVFAVQPATRDAYHALFRERAVSKTYEALAARPPAPMFPLTRHSRIEEDTQSFFRMQERPGEPNSETHIELLEQHGDLGRYRLQPVTGKRHQLRVHMAGLGLPILGDQFYPQVKRGPGEAEDFSQPLQLLARSLAFTDPVTGRLHRFDSQRTLETALRPGD
jgi:tRNA pseudouridine32 synthase/23S rRNA pseudouridine746 synthase